VKFSKRELPFVALLELDGSTLLELDGSMLLELGESSGSEPEHANRIEARVIKLTKMECLCTAKVVLWVMVLPRNIVAEYLMAFRT
jgi:hypothetical protein